MPGSRQILSMLQKSLQATSFLEPTAVLTVNPSSYLSTNIPSSITFDISILFNDATGLSWTLTDSLGNTLTTGISNTDTYVLTNPPTSVSTYTLTLNYTGGIGIKTFITTVRIDTPAYVGQLSGPSDNIVVPADLTAAILTTLDAKSLGTIVNFFPVTFANVARTVFVLPYSFGVPTALADDNDSDITDEFTLVNDTANGRYIYVRINTVTPGTYNFKVIY